MVESNQSFVVRHLNILLIAIACNFAIRVYIRGQSALVGCAILGGIALVLSFLTVRGSRFARWVLTIGSLMMGAVGLTNIFSGNSLALALSVVSLAYVYCSIAIGFSRSARSFFNKGRDGFLQ